MTTSHTIPPIAGEETMGTRERERWWESKGLVECLRDLSDQLEEMRDGKDDAALVREAAARLEGEENTHRYVPDPGGLGRFEPLEGGEVVAEGWIHAETPLRMDGTAKWKVPVFSEAAEDRMPVRLVRRREGDASESTSTEEENDA